MASALEAAHAAGIVHRDIKPENIMIRRDRIVKVLDFGLAKLASPKTAVDGQAATRSMVKTNPGMVMGTVHYMSPEQARGQDVDEGTDIWSLGVTLYEMITSGMPFEGETRSHVVVSILESEPPLLAINPEAPLELQRIVTRALRKDREQRYQTARDMAIDLKNLKQQLQVDARLQPSFDTYGRASARKSAAQTTPSTGRASTARTAEVRTAKLTSTVTYLVSEIIRHKRGATLVAVAVLFAFAVFAYFPRNRAPGPGSEAIDSLAVLPFVNEGGDSNTEYLSDGISDSIINSLSRLPALKVMSFNSVLAYKGKQTDPASIGKALNVRAVLMGRMTQQGDTLAISTELVDVRDNRRLFGEQYNRKLSDIIAVQTEIALQISERLRLRLSGEEKKLLARNYPQDTEAYRLYSLGMYCGRQNTEEALERGIEFFEQALKVDTSYTLAYMGLYGFYHQLGQGGRWLPTDARRKMEWAALKAVELDDALTEAHIKLATIRGINWDWAGSEKEYKRALELDPNSVGSNTSYSMFLLVVGRPDEAMVYANRAEEIDVDQKYASIVATVCLNKGDYDKAIELNLKKLHANQLVLREAYLAKGLYKEALELFEKEVLDDQSPVPWWGHPFRAYAYALAGRRDKALKILGDQQKAAKQRYISPFNFALIYTGLGDKDRAFEYLNKACEMHVLNLSHLRYGPLFGGLQSDPRYAELLRKMNLAV